MSRSEILAEIDAASDAVDRGFERISDEDFSKPFPEPIAKMTVPTGEWLTHLVAHLAISRGADRLSSPNRHRRHHDARCDVRARAAVDEAAARVRSFRAWLTSHFSEPVSSVAHSSRRR